MLGCSSLQMSIALSMHAPQDADAPMFAPVLHRALNECRQGFLHDLIHWG